MMMKRIILSFFFLVLAFPPDVSAEIYSTISGYVLEENTGNPIEGMNITAVRMDSEKSFVVRGVTDSKGLYILSGVIGGSYVVSLKNSKDFYSEKNRVDVTVQKGKNIVNSNYMVKKTGSVSGHVHKEDGTPYAGVIVLIGIGGEIKNEWAGRTDESGFYRVDGLYATDNGRAVGRAFGVAVVKVRGIKIVGGQETTGVDMVIKDRIESSLSIYGKVMPQGSNQGIVRVNFLIAGKTSSGDSAFVEGITDEGGNFKVYGVLPGVYEIIMIHDGYEFFKQGGIVIKEGGLPLKIDFTLTLEVGQLGSARDSPIFRLLDKVYSRLEGLDFSLVSEAYAEDDPCNTKECICSDPEVEDVMVKYAENLEEQLKKSPEEAIPYQKSLLCVSGALYSTCEEFDNPKVVTDAMACIQDEILKQYGLPGSKYDQAKYQCAALVKLHGKEDGGIMCLILYKFIEDPIRNRCFGDNIEDKKQAMKTVFCESECVGALFAEQADSYDYAYLWECVIK